MDAQKIAMITGASSGIGEATARLLAKNGYFVALLARRLDRLDVIAKELGDKALSLACDVTDKDQVRVATHKLLDRAGRIDVLINNAGIMRVGPFLDQPESNDLAQVQANLLGTLYMLRAVLPTMAKQGSGTVVNVSSVLGRTTRPGAAVYCATKWGIVALTDSLRKEFTRRNVRFIIVEPGVTRTELHPAEEYDKIAKAMNLDRMLDADDIASAILYALQQPPHVVVSEITVRPQMQDL
jgi:NADP-dependent 3-hydroxy acid dehydrogenase YdfG